MKGTLDLPVSPVALAASIDSHAQGVATAITDRQFADDPELAARFGDRGRTKCTEDARRHLSYLSSAAAVESDALFVDYVAWAKILLARIGMSETDLARNLVLLRDTIREALGGALGDAAARIVDAGLSDLPKLPAASQTLLAPTEPLADLANRYLELLLAADRQSASRLILDAVDGGVTVRDIYIHVFQRTQHEIGRRWQMNQLTVAEEHFCTAATQLTMSLLYPRSFSSPRIGRRLVAACIGGDLHEIGVRMVADFFEMEGWDTHYLGANVPLEGIVGTVAERRPDVLAISATMTYHVPAVSAVIAAVRKESPQRPYILVGGYPFLVDRALWRQVGADGFAADASSAVEQATRLVDAGRAARGAVESPPADVVRIDRRPDLYEEMTRLNSELGILQRELAKRNLELERANELKNQFLGMAAHDLRNPIAAIRSFAVLLLDSEFPVGPEQERDFLRRIKASSEFMLALINDLLDLSAIESGRVRIRAREVDVGALTRDNVEMNRALARDKRVEIDLVVDGDGPRIIADSGKIEQILNNLIGNAVKFSAPGSAVRIAVSADHGGVTLRVTDHGPGIPAAELATIFKPFERGTSRGTAGERSTGLGLAIVKRLVDGHGGRIECESEVGRGTTFSVWLPGRVESTT